MNTQDSEKQVEAFYEIEGDAKYHFSKNEDGTNNGSVFYEKRKGQAYAICKQPRFLEDEIWKDYAELISEAFNVVNETGMTPRQLQDKVKELETQLHSEKTDAFNYQCEAGVYQKANEKLQQRNDKMRELLWYWFQKAGHYSDMHVNVQRKAVETEEFFLQLKTQDDE